MSFSLRLRTRLVFERRADEFLNHLLGISDPVLVLKFQLSLILQNVRRPRPLTLLTARLLLKLLL